jgi:hypothetical protein
VNESFNYPLGENAPSAGAMSDRTNLARLEAEAERVFAESGLDPDGPMDQFTFNSGRILGERLVELWPDDPNVRDAIVRQIVREALNEFAATFPKSPDAEAEEFQTYFIGPLVSKFITGRGLTVPQLSMLAGVTPEHIYRLKRAGLAILFEETEPPTRSGVNRRFSGLDRRQRHFELDLKGLPSIALKEWPEPAATFKPFVLGVLDGFRGWLENPKCRAQIEESLRRSLPQFFADPTLGDIFDGLLYGAQRVTQRLRDEVLVMKVEKDKAQSLLDLLVELAGHRAEVLATFAQAGAAMESDRMALPAGADH